MRLDSRLVGFCGVAAAALGLLSKTCLAAGPYFANYTVNLSTSDSISNVIAVDRDSSGNLRDDWTFVLNGPGTTTLHNTNPSPVPITSFFLIGTYLDSSNADHIFLTMNEPGATAVTGLLFSGSFPGFHESNIVQAVKDITSGAPASDPTVVAGLAALNTFATGEQSLLFTGFGDPIVSMEFTTSHPVGVIAPLPAAGMQGMALLGLLATGGLVRRVLQSRKPA